MAEKIFELLKQCTLALLAKMATSRLLSRPPAGFVAQRSWPYLSRPYAFKCAPMSSRKDDSQASSFESKNQTKNRDTRFAGKVATRVGVSQPVTSQGFDSVSLWDNLLCYVSSFALKTAKRELNPSLIQGFIERVIIDCRFFTFLAVAGSLLGSILCFVEVYYTQCWKESYFYLVIFIFLMCFSTSGMFQGFIMILRSYLHYLEAILHKLDHRNTVELLVEAIDMFLVGTAMLIFGMGLYILFVKSNHSRQPRKLSKSSIFSLFNLEMLPSWMKMESVSEAKTRIGHAVLMILQVGMLDKFKSVPLVNGSDLASFAGAVLLSSASIFFLSKLSSSEA
ncbi:hypothetical protein V2J09_011735 [Rumex salicifolius]